MVAERVPRQLADEPVILMKVVARVSEHEVGIDRASSSSNASLTASPWYGRNPSRNPWTSTVGSRRARRGTPRRSRAPRRRGLRRAPSTTQSPRASGCARVSASSVPPQPISRSSEWQPIASTRRSGGSPREQREREHQAGARLAICEPTRRQGARPDSWSPSSRCRSLIVSIGPKNPSYGYATTSPRGISRANVSSTSSSPGSIQSRALGGRRRSRR